MKFDKSLLRTVLFAVGVVAMVIGIYQTIYYNDLGRNYWIFMVSMTCWMPLLYWRQQERLEAKIAEEKARQAQQARAKTPAKSAKKRR
ncbi:hypothetical protein ACFST9_11165 [Hymenobacter monticola]|uniref:Signal peptidase n=1 Tax=Hymenobacter monticola TaxID=1705399 RepID=A0ABY4B924_9BACT|nr:hypothetical protein [Hymenobacter monticola]UOE35249.1 hypothetical protein MTP16_06245 [Hymenobacter monticola]